MPTELLSSPPIYRFLHYAIAAISVFSVAGFGFKFLIEGFGDGVGWPTTVTIISCLLVIASTIFRGLPKYFLATLGGGLFLLVLSNEFIFTIHGLKLGHFGMMDVISSPQSWVTSLVFLAYSAFTLLNVWRVWIHLRNV